MSAREQNQEREPRRLIMIGYDSLEKLVSDGKIRLDDIKTLELQFNFGKMFDEVLYVVPLAGKMTSDASAIRLFIANWLLSGRALVFENLFLV